MTPVRRLLALVLALVTAGVALAEPPKSSPRPVSRPVAQQPLNAVPVTQTPTITLPDLARIAPKRRPGTVALPDGQAVPTAAATAVRPAKARRGLLALITPRAKPGKKPKLNRKGSVCGDPSIKGEMIARVTSKTKGCGIESPVRVTSVDGVRLSQAATLDCPTALALNKWVQTGLRPAFGRSEVVGLKVAAHYICRSRNNVRGAKISEHGRGKAIDISGFVLSNGEEISVQGNFNKTIRKAHKAACGIFNTTLGPGSDGYHEDHLHFDTAKHRSGTYCR